MNMLSGAHSWGTWWRPDLGEFGFPDLTFGKSGVTSKGLNKYRRGGNQSHSAAWILISYLAQAHSGRGIQWCWKVQNTLKNQQITKQGAHGESHDIEKLQLRGIFGSMYRVLLMGLNETTTGLLLIAFVLSHNQEIITANVTVLLLSPRSPCKARTAHSTGLNVLLSSCHWSRPPFLTGLKSWKMCTRKTEGTTAKRKHRGSVDGEAAV